MKFVIQCTTQASVTIDQKLYSEIGKGFLVLIGICDEDTKETADKMVRKLIGMRIFSDENGKTNLALKDVDGQLLLVSQFTLYADSSSFGVVNSFESAAASESIFSASNSAPYCLVITVFAGISLTKHLPPQDIASRRARESPSV